MPFIFILLTTCLFTFLLPSLPLHLPSSISHCVFCPVQLLIHVLAAPGMLFIFISFTVCLRSSTFPSSSVALCYVSFPTFLVTFISLPIFLPVHTDVPLLSLAHWFLPILPSLKIPWPNLPSSIIASPIFLFHSHTRSLTYPLPFTDLPYLMFVDLPFPSLPYLTFPKTRPFTLNIHS